jgi:hypothetical protein
MRRRTWLFAFVAVLGLVVSGVGVLTAEDVNPVAAATIRGESVELYGEGLYRFDTVFQAANNRSTDLVTLLIGLPLLGISLRWAARGSLRGRLLLLGTLGYFLYVSTGYAMGAVAYNEMFLVYVAWFSASLFAFGLVFGSFRPLPAQFEGLPRRWPGVFMVISGMATLAIWVMDPLTGLVEATPPKGLDSYTTLFTHALDIGIIVPAAVIAGIMIWRRRSFGYVVAFSLLVLEALLMPVITIATIFQLQLGMSFTPAEVIGPIVGFSLLAGSAIWVISVVLRRIPEVSSTPGNSMDKESPKAAI